MAKKSLLQDFKDFAVRGNLLDLAIGIIIGTAFTRIVNSLVQSVIMPALGMVVGNFDFKHLQWVLKPAEVDATGSVVQEAVIIKYGEFIQAFTDFLIIAIIVFIVVKMLNSWKNEAEDPENPKVKTPKDIQLLTDIRDLLKEQNNKPA